MRAILAGFAMSVLAGCSSAGLGDFSRPTASAPSPAAAAIRASLTIADTVAPSDWVAIRETIVAVPADRTDRRDWSNRRTGSSGYVTVLALPPAGESNGCRLFTTSVNDDRGVRQYRGSACLRNDGQWQLFGVTADDATLL